MTSLNDIAEDQKCTTSQPEILIELPSPKIIDENCTIVVNGHHNYGMTEEKETKIHESSLEEKSPTNHTENQSKSVPNGKAEAVSKELSSADEDSDVGIEPESSSLLLRDQEAVDQSPKCLKNKSKLPNFKSSPSKKQNNQDPHSHIQHRPLGMLQDTTSDHFVQVKRYWPFSSLACLFLSLSLVLVLVACLVTGLYLTISNNCSSTKEWWHGSTIYEIFPASFQDSDGDGFGDIKGLIDRLDYVQNLGVKVLRLNSIFSALDYPLEYEHVIDFANIDPHLGRLEDFQHLVKEIHRRGMYVILDMNPTVTSDQHTWAAHWLLHRPGPYQHFYINETDGQDEVPSLENYLGRNWTVFHRTFGDQLYLNYSNSLVQIEIRSIIQMWLSYGVDGFYMKHLENIHTPDSDISQILLQWRQILDTHSVNSTHKILIVALTDLQYMQDTVDPLTFIDVLQAVDLLDVSLGLTANETMINEFDEVREAKNFLMKLPFAPAIIWHTGSVETTRLGGRIGDGNNLAALFIVAFLPGSFSTFYGDEIGMEDSFNPETLEVFRGGQLAPMQWSSGPQSNFTSEESSPWLPLHPSYYTRNVLTQAQQLQLFKKMVNLKQRNDGSLPSTGSTRTSLMESLVVRFRGSLEDGALDYEWFHNPCGLVVAKIVHCDVFAASNFGSTTLNLREELNSAVMTSLIDFVTLDHMERPFDIVISTNRSLQNSVKFHDIYLGPGSSVIGQFVS